MALWLVEYDFDTASCQRPYQAVLVSLAVAGFGTTAQGQGGAIGVDPVELSGAQAMLEQARVVIALDYHQDIAFQVLVGNVPGALRTTDATYAKSLALSQGVVHQALVLAQYRALIVLHHPGLCRQVARQEILETTLTDEANTGAVFLVMGD